MFNFEGIFRYIKVCDLFQDDFIGDVYCCYIKVCDLFYNDFIGDVYICRLRTLSWISNKLMLIKKLLRSTVQLHLLVCLSRGLLSLSMLPFQSVKSTIILFSFARCCSIVMDLTLSIDFFFMIPEMLTFTTNTDC